MKYETLALNVLFSQEKSLTSSSKNFSENLKVHNNQIDEDGMVFRFDSYDRTCLLFQIYTLLSSSF